MFGQKNKANQPKKDISHLVEKKDDGLSVHIMPSKFLSGSTRRKTNFGPPGQSTGSGIKKNLVIGVAVVIVLGVLMLVAAWLFLKSINKQPAHPEQPVSPVTQSGTLTSVPQPQPPQPTPPDPSQDTPPDQDQTPIDQTPDISKWTTYNDDKALFNIKYPPSLEFKPLQFSESFQVASSSSGRILGIGRLNIAELDYAQKQYKEAALRDRHILEQQGLFGEIFDSSFEPSREVIKVNKKNIKIYTILETEDQQPVLERRAMFYNGDYQIVIILKEDKDSVAAQMADYFTQGDWNQAGQYTQSRFFNLLQIGNAQQDIQQWYDLFDYMLSSLVIVEQTQDQDSDQDQDITSDDQPTSSQEVPPGSLDMDEDKLTDVEEEMYSSSPNMPDTDQDGYLDGDELINFYSPLKPGQTLDSSGLVEAYLNTQYGYIIYYPSMWSQEELDAHGETVMFTSETTEFVEVIVQENMSGITNIRSWYLSQMAGIEPSKVANLMVDGLIGVRSPDGMNVYFMKDNLIYTISYNINLKEKTNFMTTFEMMVKSFKLFDNPLDQ